MTLKNTDTQAQTITSAAAPAAPFTATMPAGGTVVAAGGTVTVPVTFQPTAAGTTTGILSVTTASGTTLVTLTGTGGTVAPAGQPIPGPTDTSWVRNGAATLSGTDLLLTRAGGGAGAGSSFYPVPVPVHGLHATFTSSIGGGSGADGLTFALLDPSSATAAALGGAGGGLGFTGLTGTAVALDTYKNGTEPSNNFIGIATSTVTSTGTIPYNTTSTAVPTLRTGTHIVTVDYTAANHLVVAIDGTAVFDLAETVPRECFGRLHGRTGSEGRQPHRQERVDHGG